MFMYTERDILAVVMADRDTTNDNGSAFDRNTIHYLFDRDIDNDNEYDGGVESY